MVLKTVSRTEAGMGSRVEKWIHPSFSILFSLPLTRQTKTLELTVILENRGGDGSEKAYIELMKISYIYILKCADDSYYTGVTSNLYKRLMEHQSSKYPDSYTSQRLPVELVFYAEFTDINIAISKEKQVKNWSRAKKEALIEGTYEELPNLAKKKFKK